MKRVVRKFKSFSEAERFEIQEQISMTPEQRQAVAQALKARVFGRTAPDVRDKHGEK
jgi:hypothetical protein